MVAMPEGDEQEAASEGVVGGACLHLRCRLCIHTLPVGNALPMFASDVAGAGSSSCPQQQQQQQQDADAEDEQPQQPALGEAAVLPPRTPKEDPTIADTLSFALKHQFVDAHSVPSARPLEETAQLITKAMPYAMKPDEVFMRRQIAETLIISMGNRIEPFEGKIDPITGVIDIDHVFRPIVSKDEHLRDLHACDTSSPLTKIKDCAVMRTYMTNPDPKTGDHSSMLLGCEPIDLVQLMRVSSDMSTPGAIHPSQYRKYDFCTFTNFSNTFTAVSVLPVEGKVVAMGQEGYNGHHHPEPLSPDHYSEPVAISPDAMMQQLHVGLRLVTTAADREAMAKAADGMRSELQRLGAGLALYRELLGKAEEQEEKQVDLRQVHFMPSILRSLPEIQSAVHLQQGLQYAYCQEGVRRNELLVTEPHSLQFAPTATALQTHMASICFPDMSRIHRMRYAPVPRDQIMVQFFAAMNACGLEPDDILRMNAAEHPHEIVAMLNAIFSAGQLDQLDQVQTPYYSDYVLHSYEPVPEHIATANLKPVPGYIEYVQGCCECLYRMHSVYITAKGGFQDVYVRYNLSPSEDLKQPRTCKTLDSQRNRDDCETQGQDQVATIMSAKAVYADLRSAPAEARLKDYIHPVHFQNCSTDYQGRMFRAYIHLFSLVKDIHPYCNVGNARAAQAGGGDGAEGPGGTSYCGHSYPGVLYKFPGTAATAGEPLEVRCILEGTKWVNPMLAYSPHSSSLLQPATGGDGTTNPKARSSNAAAFARLMGNASTPSTVISSINMLCTILEEMTKCSPDDIGTTELEMFQDAETGFYANTYVCDNMIVTRESIPGVPRSARALGAPVPYTTHNVPSLHLTPHMYSLVTRHMIAEGLADLRPDEIQGNVDSMAMEEALPAWGKEQWDKNVFSRYLPCTVLHEAKGAFEPGKHYAISFTRQMPRGMTIETAKAFADTVLAVLHNHQDPPITALHAARIHDAALYPPLMPPKTISAVQGFDVAAVNASARAAFAAAPEGAVRVEKIFTAMGCVIVTCVLEIASAQTLCAGLSNWIKPIAEAYTRRHEASVQWRTSLEMQQGSSGDDRSVRIINVGAACNSIGTIHPQVRPLPPPSSTIEAPLSPNSTFVREAEDMLRAANML